MAYASTYDKFEDLEYTQMLKKTKQTKMYAKKRRLKFCGIAFGASYNVNTTPPCTTMTTTLTPHNAMNMCMDEYTTDMIKQKASSGNKSSKKKSCCESGRRRVTSALLGCFVVVGLVGLVVWVAYAASSHNSSASTVLSSAASPPQPTTTTIASSVNGANAINTPTSDEHRRTQTATTTTTTTSNGDASRGINDAGSASASARTSSLVPAVVGSSLPDYSRDENQFISDATVNPTPATISNATRQEDDEFMTKDENVDYVTPIKLGPKPLHTHDILYDEARNISSKKTKLKVKQNTETDQLKIGVVQVRDRSHEDDQDIHTTIPSGHFRDNTAQVFDPHPEYAIEAFGRKFKLDLSHSSEALLPDLRVLHIQDNYSRKIESKTKPACYYTGTIQNDVNSFAGVSLCNGMTGFMRTTHGEFYIEPIEDYGARLNANSSIRHRMTRLPVPEDAHLGDHGHDAIVSNPIIFETSMQDHKKRSPRSVKQLVHRYDDEVFNRYEDDIVNHGQQPYQTHQYQAAHYLHSGDDKEQRSFPDTGQNTKPYFIATLVVIDRKMFEYHKNAEDLTRYILTLMSHVAWLFKDATIGNPITLAVVDIKILENADFSSSTSTEMLGKFCNSEHVISHKQHDVALLFTRNVICRNASTHICTTLGMAEVESMCKPGSSCAIVRDTGLSTSFTVAHELGHMLSMYHDDDSKCAKHNNGTIPNNIMAQSFHNDARPWHWSRCSKQYLTEFLGSGLGNCLLDEPLQDHIHSNPLRSNLLPGETFQADEQCDLAFGRGSRMCSYIDSLTEECSNLWCTHKNDTVPGLLGCQTQYMPWAEGTACGIDKLCLQGKCIHKHSHDFKPTAGRWGAFKPSGSCSRTCGGGVQRYDRECNNPPPSNGGPYCTGGSTYHESCNTQPCPTDAPDFREVQCAHYNGNTKGVEGLTSSVRWVPKYGAPRLEDACKLYCRVDGSTAYYELERKVKDGTKCGLNSFDICINGICRPGGCDNILGSNATLNDCGICGADNSQCRTISGQYNLSIYEYSAVVLIPKGSSNIVIRQISLNGSYPDENYLALRQPDSSENRNSYLLNGYSVISSYNKEIVYGGVTFNYSGSTGQEENITTPRKARLTKDILVEILQVGNISPSNVYWSYTVRESESPNYRWEQFNWTSCDSLCQGYKHPVPRCVDLTVQQIVHNNYCSSLPRGKPVECNVNCKLEWRVIPRTACDCETGWRDLEFECVQVDISAKKQYGDRNVDKKHCANIVEPSKRERCDNICGSIHWKYNQWSACTKSCGGGYQERHAICVDSDNNLLNDTYCPSSHKHVERVCNTDPCPTWYYQEWSECSVTCGKGIKHRFYGCRKGNQVLPSNFCDSNTLVAKEACIIQSCNEPLWMKGDWNECNGECGSTYQQRLVTCMDATTQKSLNDEHCRSLPKPADSRACTLPSCEYEWITGDWSGCSAHCGWGQQSRQVRCAFSKSRRAIDNRHADRYCNMATRPEEIRNCQGQFCESRSQNKPINWQNLQWVPGKFGKCSTMCGSGTRTREVKCYASTNGTRVKIVDESCNHLAKKPPATKPCKRYNCSYAWKETNWSSCSATCGPGIKRRDAFCYRITRNHRQRFRLRNVRHMSCLDKKVPENFCPIISKPRVKEECNEMNCYDPYHWKKTSWQSSRQRDGAEKQKRRVYCVDRQNNRVDDKNCLSLGIAKPKRRRKFSNNLKPCGVAPPAELSYPGSCREVQEMTYRRENNDYTLMLNGAVVNIYCYKMDTNDPEEFITLPPGSSNFAEIYNRRLPRFYNRCPNRDEYDCASCDIVESGGKSMFWKVRIDIRSMHIIADDFTFSQNTTQHRVPYGTAGDCFTALSGCVRGRFNIDLSGTSFRLAQNVMWIATGQNPTKKITQNNRHKINGICGGHCGGCIPNPRIGLKVEVT